MKNIEVRKKIEEKRLKHYEVAEAVGVHASTFCRWLSLEMSEQKKAEILKVLEEM